MKMSSEGSLVGEFINNVDDSDWLHLAGQVSSEFQFLDQNWFLSWETKYLSFEYPNTHVKYLSITDINKKLQGVYPYMLISKFGLKILSSAGFYFPFRMILHSTKLTASCANTFVETIHHEPKANIVRIGPAEIDQPINHILKSSFQDFGWMCHEINRGDQQIATLPGSVDEFKQSLSKNLHKNLKSRLKKLQKLGVVTIEKFNNCSSNKWAQVIEVCSEIESQSWLSGDTDVKPRIKGKEAFWKKYLENNDAQRRVSIWLVQLNSYPISFTLAIDSGSSRYSISGQYNAQFKKYGVGLLADYEMLQDSIHMGFKTVNFGLGEAEYKDRWGTKPGSQLVDYIYFRPGMLGYLLHSVLKVREATRSIHSQHGF
jgi:hypothetical protein